MKNSGYTSSHPRCYTIGLIQMFVTTNPDDNLRRAIDKIREAATKGAKIICLPELFRSQYFCQCENAALFDLAEPVPGPTTTALGEAARSLNVIIVAPVFERRAAGVYHNSAAIIETDGTIAGLYRKMHIPDDPSYYEKFYFTPGDLGFKAFNTSAGTIGTMICWDQWYPEGARLTTMQGADILLYPTAIGWHPHEKTQFGEAQRDAWRTVQRGHAVANGVYVAAVNRIGYEIAPEGDASSLDRRAGIEFWGSSFIADPQGVIIAEASTDKEEILLAEVDTSRIEEVRRNWPFLRDRRIDAYEGITRRILNNEPWSSTP
ncbi:MAG: carbon-nitrogen hydrolase [Ignavibacteria bacterium]|nr:carbon-nitrogen hydrolase [Ignavibacteria bacterium]